MSSWVAFGLAVKALVKSSAPSDTISLSKGNIVPSGCKVE